MTTYRAAQTAAAAAAPDLGHLPEWDLKDLYTGRDAPELARDLDNAEKIAKDFRERYTGKLAGLSGADLAAAVASYEQLDEMLGRVGSFASLTSAGNQIDPEISKFAQTMRERLNGISTQLIFFRLEINKIDDADMARKLKDPKLARYAPWLRDVRVWRPHDLPDEQERLLHEKRVAGADAWSRLFDETMAGLRFPVNGKDLGSAEALHLLSDRDRKVREAAGKSVGKVLGDNVRLFALITNTLAKDKEIEDRWRKFPRPISSMNLANLVEDEVVDALIAAVRAAYPKLSHRYYAMKAKWFGLKQLEYWDRNAPLPESDEQTIPWAKARDTVLEAYGKFSPDLASVGKKFFDSAWIDAPVRPGKSPGAFAHPTVPSAHPYLLVNYLGKTRDVMTLAHELGHGVHQVLAGKQGQLLSGTPLTLAETASVFGEMLTFRSMLDNEKDPKRRKAMLAGKVEDMLNTVVRQIAFCEFERRIHDERRQGEMTPERICEIWMSIQGESLGPALHFDEEYKYYWTYIPHFIHSPFYVYAYAFGDCLVNSLYAAYRKTPAGFAEKYLDMLKAGGSKRHQELLAPFGFNAADPAFWSIGLSVVEGFIDELEKLDG
jgi:oligoendopeptidase F